MNLTRVPFLGRLLTKPAALPDGRRSALFDEQAIETMLVSLMGLSDPDYILTKVGIARHQLDQTLTDDEILGAYETRRDAALATPWHLEPGVGMAAEFIEGELRRFFPSIAVPAWRSVFFGYQVAEAVYEKRDGGRIGLAKVEGKPIEWFKPRPDGSLRFFPADGSGGAEGIEVDTQFKFFLTRHSASYKNPYGEALLARLYWPWLFRYHGWKFWMSYLDKFGDPLLLASVNNPQEFVALMEKLGIRNVIAAGMGGDLKAVTPSATGAFDALDAAICRRVQKLILGQTLTTDVGSSGSYAAAKVHDNVRADKRRADLRRIAESVQQVINALTLLNFAGTEPPRLIIEDEVGIEAERATRDATLVQAGILELTEDYLLRVYDYDDGDIIVPPTNPPAGGNTPPPPGKPGTQPAKPGTQPAKPGTPGAKASAAELALAKRRKATPAQENLEGIVAGAIERAGEIGITVADIRAAIMGAADPEDLATRLAILIDEGDESFPETLAAAIFAGEVLGWVASDRGNT